MTIIKLETKGEQVKYLDVSDPKIGNLRPYIRTHGITRLAENERLELIECNIKKSKRIRTSQEGELTPRILWINHGNFLWIDEIRGQVKGQGAGSKRCCGEYLDWSIVYGDENRPNRSVWRKHGHQLCLYLLRYTIQDITCGGYRLGHRCAQIIDLYRRENVLSGLQQYR